MRRRGGPPPRGHFDGPYPPRPPPDYYDGFGPPPSPPWERRDPYGYPPSPPPPPPGPPRGWYDRPLTPPPPWLRDDDLPPPPPPRRPPPSSFADDDFYPPPPPFRSNGPPRGRGRGEGRGGSQGRGRGDASTSRGGSQGRGSATRGGSNSRGTRGATSSRGSSSGRGGFRGGNNSSRGTPGRGAARGTSSVRGMANGRGGSASNSGTATWLNKARGDAQTGNVGNSSNQSVVQTENTPQTTNATKTANMNNYQSYSMLNKAKKEQKKVENTVLKAAIPGQLNFISFKNSLQECCQKQQLPVPAYKSWKFSYGYAAKVEVAGNTFKSTGVQGDQKEAQQNAAYNALVGLGLIDSTVPFDVKTAAAIKRPAVDNSVIEDASGKRIKLESSSPVATSYKSRLNEFCQKFRLSLPSYDTVKTETGKGFITTIVFNKKVYQSNGPQPTKKLAEQNAAQVVLHMLNQCPAPPPNCQDFVERCKQLSSQSAQSSSTGTSVSTTSLTTSVAVAQIPLPSAPAPAAGQTPASTSQTNPALTVQSTASATITRFSSPIVEKITTPMTQPSVSAATVIEKPTTAFTSHKNTLQEYCQKSKIAMPVYFSHRENGVFTCTVHVAGVTYSSTSCNTKKGSEQTAASVALKALGLM